MNESLRDLGESITALFRQAIDIAKAEVDDILQTDDRNANRIEPLLDMMLGYCRDHDMLFEYKRLCRHYYTINPQATADYVHAYRDLWDTPEAADSVEGFEKVPAVSAQSAGSAKGEGAGV